MNQDGGLVAQFMAHRGGQYPSRFLGRAALATHRVVRRTRRHITLSDERRDEGVATTVPEVPIGAKIELTHRCNLLCSFCYTDSPMKTLKREPELSDNEWLAVIDDVIALGVVEAVLTGGEPLLRKKLTIEAARRLSDAGVAVIINTNGWFVDDVTAATLSAMPNVRVSVSIDGITPELHDTARGVPGSWIHAIEATHRLLSHGADVRVNHVVTPINEREVEAFVDAMVAFGVCSLRVSGAGLSVGAVSRDGDWRLDNDGLARVMSASQRRHHGRLALRYLPQSGDTNYESAPATFLLRPDGSMVLDSRRALKFGTTPVDVRSAWSDVRAFWSVEGSRGVEERLAGHVAYREDDVAAAGVADIVAVGGATGRESSPFGTPVEIGTRPSTRDARQIPLGVPILLDAGDVDAGRAIVDAFALSRRYKTAPLRWAGDADGQRSIRTANGSKHTVDRRAGAMLDAFVRGQTMSAALSLGSMKSGVPIPELRLIAGDLIRRKLIVADPQ
jgi:uncharacterized Fe-S cluster-containing radical SAM superfamily protein